MSCVYIYIRLFAEFLLFRLSHFTNHHEFNFLFPLTFSMDSFRQFYKVCKKCKKEFKAKSTFYLHRKDCGVPNDEISDPFKTCECGKKIAKRSLYYSHRKNCEHVFKKNGKDSVNYVCLQENCSFVSHLKVNFLNHLKETHSICCEEEIKTFQDYAGIYFLDMNNFKLYQINHL